MKNEREVPLLSILIPAYCYPKGVIRILEKVVHVDERELDILIFDDSPDDSVKETLVERGYINRVQYKKNEKSSGAIGNWNSLLERSKTDYRMLIHHDEFFEKKTDIEDLIHYLKKNETTKVFLLNCLLNTKVHFIGRLHFSLKISKLILGKLPEYLFKRNFIGPTACLVISKEVDLRFDEKLKWLVDVDFYYRVFQKIGKDFIKFLPIFMRSEGRRDESISSSIKHEVEMIRKREIDYLSTKYSKKIIWLNEENNIKRLIEIFVWACLKLYSYVFRLKTLKVR